jgi:putative aminopeptidase FrvX
MYERNTARSTLGLPGRNKRDMDTRTLRRILRRILSSPTAPFHEYHVRDTLVELFSGMRHVSMKEDAFGNLIATYRCGRKRGHFAFGAHMDHPGWVRTEEEGGGEHRAGDGTEWEFLGGVPEVYRKKPKLKFFGDFAMWDLPAMEEREGMVYSRACDDLINCATMVGLFHELERKEVEATCYAVFTRAEEVGFVGATEMAKAWPFGDEVTFVSLETSAPVPEAEFGKGPVLRVGDRLSIFDHGITGFFSEVAAAEKIPVQRLLLNRGACEATAFQAFGVRTAGVSILLGNYHNCGKGHGIEAEYVSLADVKSMVELITAATMSGSEGGVRGRSSGTLRRRLGKIAREHGRHVRATKGFFGEAV